MKYLRLIIGIIFSTTLFADGVQPVGSGMESDPYQVEILDNLLWISTNSFSWDSYFIQTDDIDASETANWNNGEGFNPIGMDSFLPFSGYFDGQDCIISNLHINRPYESGVGFFNCLMYDAIISNLGLENVNVTGNEHVGGLVGSCTYNTLLENCFITGTVNGNLDVGGLVGFLQGANINNCYSSGLVNCSAVRAGGLTGKCDWGAIITNSHSSCDVNGSNYTGGLVGDIWESDIINCYCSGYVEGDNYVGGFIGGNSYYSLISNSYCTGDVSGENNVGGFAGYNASATITDSYSIGDVSGYCEVGGFVGRCLGDNSSIDKCFSTGLVEGNTDVGGFSGKIFVMDTVTNSFWDIDTSGHTTSAGGTGKTTIEMQDVATYTSLSTVGLEEPWDFAGNPFDDTGNEDYWDIDPVLNDGYPFLTSVPLVGVQEVEISQLHLYDYYLTNYPNPFNPETIISFSVTQSPSTLEIVVFNLKGQKVKTLVCNNFYAANTRDSCSTYSVIWNGDDHFGKAVSTGIYYYALSVDGKIQAVKKCLLMK